MKKNYLHTTILKFLLEKHKEELEELENEDTNQPDEDVIDNEIKTKDKLKAIKPDEDPEDTNLDEVIKEYFKQQEKRKKKK